MAQQVKVSVAMPEDLRSILGTNMIERTGTHKSSDLHVSGISMFTHTHTKKQTSK